MIRFTYKARALDGEIVESKIRAKDERQARLSLSEKGLEVLSMESPAAPEAGGSKYNVDIEQKAEVYSTEKFHKIKTSALRDATAQLALLLETGTPLSESLRSLSEQLEEEWLGDTLSDVNRLVNEGSTLSDALKAHPEAFSQFYVSSVQAGEASGNLVEVFKQLEIDMEKREALLSQVRAALIYPMILSTLALFAVLFLVYYVLPKFVVVFESSGAILPLPTRMLMTGTGLMQEFWYLVLFALVAPCVGGYFWAKSSWGKPQ